ncbi:MAG: hypothetical protein FJX78_00560 [Armatimonadetes bacterium]|nr:hypothetical protein [Armatimonadota bacterium]
MPDTFRHVRGYIDVPPHARIHQPSASESPRISAAASNTPFDKRLTTETADVGMPRFSGIPTFFRLPFVADARGLDVAILGVPLDGGQYSLISGVRFGPRFGLTP